MGCATATASLLPRYGDSTISRNKAGSSYTVCVCMITFLQFGKGLPQDKCYILPMKALTDYILQFGDPYCL